MTDQPEAQMLAEMLATWDRFIGGDRDADEAAAKRLILAACFAAQAYEDAISGALTADGAPAALLRAFLIALIDDASPELDHLRMCNRPNATSTPS